MLNLSDYWIGGGEEARFGDGVVGYGLSETDVLVRIQCLQGLACTMPTKHSLQLNNIPYYLRIIPNPQHLLLHLRIQFVNIGGTLLVAFDIFRRHEHLILVLVVRPPLRTIAQLIVAPAVVLLAGLAVSHADLNSIEG